ncbi:hypothetical protein L2E82_19229 [Cichorium intybus]|uniref:Uncharacterized protein n=1 Tax=Cichorium intybus TaxID=13427 RepID=A0ACB9FBR7_CICIN|nr:hypothetical protein L2E82_19229 [Cichorium intybus]
MLIGRKPICFTTAFLSLSIILMATMIKDCDGWTAACNGSTTAECPFIKDEEQEFLMDTEEHRRILLANRHLVSGAQNPTTPACFKNCNGNKKYNVRGRQCKTYDKCRT